MIRRNWFLGAELERNGIDVTRCLRSRLLHRIGDLCPCLPCTVCPLGSCGSLPNQVASGVAVAACRFAVLGNPYSGSSLAVRVDDAGKLLERQAGVQPYQGGFLLHFLDSVVYADISATLLASAGVVVCSVNLMVCVWRICAGHSSS